MSALTDWNKRRAQANELRNQATELLIQALRLEWDYVSWRILEEVAVMCNVTIPEICIDRRCRKAVTARMILSYLLREQRISYPRIAIMLGYINHTTIIYHHALYKRQMNERPEFKAKLDEIIRKARYVETPPSIEEETESRECRLAISSSHVENSRGPETPSPVA